MVIVVYHAIVDRSHVTLTTNHQTFATYRINTKCYTVLTIYNFMTVNDIHIILLPVDVVVVGIVELDIVNELRIVVVVVHVILPVGTSDSIIRVVTQSISLFYIPYTIYDSE